MSNPYLDEQLGSTVYEGPSRIWYFVAVLVLGAGVGLFAWLLIGGLTDIGGSLQRVVVPGEHVLRLDEPGTYTVFNEYNSVVDGKVYSSPRGLTGLRCTLTRKSDGTEIPLTQPGATSRYSMNGRSGVSLLNFEVDTPGEYVLTTTLDGGPDAQGVLAVGQGFVGKLLGVIFTCIAVLLAGVGLSVTILVVTLAKRSRARKAAMPPLPGGLPETTDSL